MSAIPDPTSNDLLVGECVTCGGALEVEGCCSSSCALEAHRECERNAAALRRGPIGADGDERRQLAERNGRLTSALLRWRAAAPSFDGDDRQERRSPVA